jgi:hypothetical protein
MLQVFHMDVAKVDLILHMLQWDHLPQSHATVLGRYQAGTECLHLHARGKRTGHERSPCVTGQVGGACGPGGAGPAWHHEV